MSKLSPSLKNLINATFARPGTVTAPSHIRSVYASIGQEAKANGVGLPSWLTISLIKTAATMTMNSPESLTVLHQLVAETSSNNSSTENTLSDHRRAVWAAGLMREVGLKCISFNGIPRTINNLGAFRASLPEEVATALPTHQTRKPHEENIRAIERRGKGLWDSVYFPYEDKLYDKLAESHPDLPIHILNSHYGPLLADFPKEALKETKEISDKPSTSAVVDLGDEVAATPKVGRVLTSVVAVACLRAQTGVGPQVLSHIFGLRKAYEDGTFEANGEETVQGGEWLSTDEGSVWLLESVDKIVDAIGAGRGTTFAPGIRSAETVDRIVGGRNRPVGSGTSKL